MWKTSAQASPVRPLRQEVPPIQIQELAGWMDLVGYGTLIIGYLVALASAARVTVAGFVLLTAANGIWLVLFHMLNPATYGRRTTFLTLLGLAGVSALAEVAVVFGLNWDFLLILLTVAIVSLVYELRAALELCAAIWLVSTALLVLLASTAHIGIAAILQSVATLLPAYAFCFLMPRSLRQQMAQRSRAEALVRQLQEAQEQLRDYASEVEELTVTRERNRMAREIHDTLGHHLTILAVKLEAALKLEERDDPRLREELTEARRVASECLSEVRSSVGALRPADPTAISFVDALARLTTGCEQVMAGAEVALDVEGPAQDLAPELRLALYRCAQESLTNIRKHAQATKVLVRLRVDEREAALLVRDNGRGAASAAPGAKPGFGLLGMRERIALLGGQVRSTPEAERGWRVEVTVPLHAEMPPHGEALPAGEELAAPLATGLAQLLERQCR